MEEIPSPGRKRSTWNNVGIQGRMFHVEHVSSGRSHTSLGSYDNPEKPNQQKAFK